MLGRIHGGNLRNVGLILMETGHHQGIFSRVVNRQFCVLVRLACRMEARLEWNREISSRAIPSAQAREVGG